MSAAIDAVFGPPGKRRALVVAGACGNVGYGKLGQFARLLARHGVPVVGLDVLDAVHEVPAKLRAELGKKFPPAEVESIAGAIRTVKGGVEDVPGEIGFLFEAVPERLSIKQPLYRALRARHPEALLFSATSGFTTKQLFGGLPGADRSGVLHPFFPHLTNKIFEFPTDGLTGPETREKARALLEALGLMRLDVRDVASFAADRIFCMLMLEAVRIHLETGLDPAAVDAIVRRAVGASPFLVHNSIRGANGLTVHCIDLLTEEHRSTLFDVPAEFRRLAGDPSLAWPYDRAKSSFREAEYQAARERILGNVLCVSAYIHAHGIATSRDLNFLAEEALRWRLGPPGLIREVGLSEARRIAAGYLSLRKVTEAAVVAPLAGLEKAAAGDLYVTAEDAGGGVRVVRIGRSTLNHLVVEELGRAARRWVEDPAVRAVVLAPDGRYNEEFGRGADVSGFLPALGDAGKGAEIAAGWKAALAPIHAGGKPVVAALARRSLGGSNELAFLTSYRVAAKGTTMAQPEPVVGLLPGLGGTHTLLRSVPASSRSEVVHMLLTGDAIDADRALALGLVQEVVPAKDLVDAAVRSAGRLADGSLRPPAVERGPFSIELPQPLPDRTGDGLLLDLEYMAFLGESLKGVASRTYDEAMAWESEQSGRSFCLKSASIGVKALLVGKKPQFRS